MSDALDKLAAFLFGVAFGALVLFLTSAVVGFWLGLVFWNAHNVYAWLS
jgi:hypothetical protein